MIKPKNSDDLRVIIDDRESNNITNLNDIDVSDIKNMDSLFSYTSLDFDISKWDVRNVTTANSMFLNSTQNWDINDLEFENLKYATYMFAYSKMTNTIEKWTVPKLKEINSMFESSDYNKPLNFKFSNVTHSPSMFEDSKFNQDISNWNTRKLSYANSMFKNSPFNQDISNWDMKKLKSAKSMFENSKLSVERLNWSVPKLDPDLTENIFKGIPKIPNISTWFASNDKLINNKELTKIMLSIQLGKYVAFLDMDEYYE